MLRQRPDVLQILGGRRMQGVRQSRDARRELPNRRVPQIHLRLRAWDAWGVGLLRIDRERLIRRGIAAPDLSVH